MAKSANTKTPSASRPGKRPARFRRRTIWFGGIILVAAGVIAAFVLTRPAATVSASGNDKLTDQQLITISNSIEAYKGQRGELPAALSDLSLSGDAARLVNAHKVDYKTDGLIRGPSVTNTGGLDLGNCLVEYTTNGPTCTNDLWVEYRYQLCVKYDGKAQKPSYTKITNPSDADSSGYTTHPYTASHPAGRVCYKLRTNTHEQ